MPRPNELTWYYVHRLLGVPVIAFCNSISYAQPCVAINIKQKIKAINVVEWSAFQRRLSGAEGRHKYPRRICSVPRLFSESRKVMSFLLTLRHPPQLTACQASLPPVLRKVTLQAAQVGFHHLVYFSLLL